MSRCVFVEVGCGRPSAGSRCNSDPSLSSKRILASDEIEHLLQQEENREWAWTHVHRDTKEHFLRYGGRYVLRPPISENRILDTAEGLYGSARSDAELMGGSVGAGVSESTYGQAMRGSRYGAEAACIY
jgi:hypothetical protein